MPATTASVSRTTRTSIRYHIMGDIIKVGPTSGNIVVKRYVPA
jgi:hypothetical protein